MTGIDTYVLVRYFLDDDPAQANRVDVFMRECRANHERVFVSCIVLCEFAWTLRSFFRLDRSRILRCIEELLDAELFVVEQDDSVRSAVNLAMTSKGDFPDFLIGAIGVEKLPLHCHSIERNGAGEFGRPPLRFVTAATAKNFGPPYLFEFFQLG
jgi:predicted nucleic-acid-binding protein